VVASNATTEALTTATTLLDKLEDAGQQSLVLAVDIGGTKMDVAVVDGSGGFLWRDRRETPGSPDGEDVFAPLGQLVAEAVRFAGDRLVACGVGCGGPMAQDGVTVSPLNIPAWRDFPLGERLKELSGVPTLVDNDAKALALGEGWIGGARGCGNYLAMVVSTGVGGGLVMDGKLLEGASGNAGHIGHVVVEPEGRACACGGRGCLEAEASGLSIEAITGFPAKEASLPVRQRTGTLVGRAVASVASLLDLPLALVGGSVALGFGEPFFAAARDEVSYRCGLSFARETRVVPVMLGERGPLVGAAALGWNVLPGGHRAKG
jgi:glucokinase